MGVLLITGTTGSHAAPPSHARATIKIGSYYHGPCTGKCPSFEITVHDDGLVEAAQLGLNGDTERISRLTVNTSDLASFRAALEPLKNRPARSGLCHPTPLWYDEKTVQWTVGASVLKVAHCGTGSLRKQIARALLVIHINPASGVPNVNRRDMVRSTLIGLGASAETLNMPTTGSCPDSPLP